MTKRPKYFTPSEVAIHNTAKDMWVSFLGKVYDLTPFLQANAGKIYYSSLNLSHFEKPDKKEIHSINSVNKIHFMALFSIFLNFDEKNSDII